MSVEEMSEVQDVGPGAVRAIKAALEQLVADRWIQAEERIVPFNTGTGINYPGAFAV